MNLKTKIKIKRQELEKDGVIRKRTIVEKYGWRLVVGLVFLGFMIGATYVYSGLEIVRIFTATKTVLIVNPANAQTIEKSSELVASAEGNQVPIGMIRESLPNIGQTPEDIQKLIEKTFPEDSETMLAIAKAESKLKAKAQNWNCYYNADETIVYKTKVPNSHSTSCREEHKKYAWSVDCGIMQINMQGKNCSAELFDPVQNLKVARKIYDTQGLTAWVTYNYAIAHNRPI